MLYPIVALIWLVLALILFITPGWLPERLRTFPGTDVSLGWFCILLFVWRLYGWQQWRARNRQTVLHPGAPPPRPRVVDEYNPEFDFERPDPERRDK